MADLMSKVTIITRPEKLEPLREALFGIGVQGITVTKVEGCGVQQGVELIVRGVKKQMYLIPKVQLDVYVCAIPVEDVIDVAMRELQTGEYGDGKIFVSDVKEVVRVRTGERGKEALRNIDLE